jgi:hypothetical protein
LAAKADVTDGLALEEDDLAGVDGYFAKEAGAFRMQ